ncbi:unnamed protein product [Rhodiola kirilowii]
MIVIRTQTSNLLKKKQQKTYCCRRKGGAEVRGTGLLHNYTTSDI